MLKGTTIALHLKRQLKKKVDVLPDKPCLATIQIGNDPASALYVQMKDRACEEVGIRTKDYRLPDNCRASKLALLTTDLDMTDDINGVMIEKPFNLINNTGAHPEDLVDPVKDVDGTHRYNFGRLSRDGLINGQLAPCTPQAVLTLLKANHVDVAGKSVAIINRSDIVGLPLALMLIHKGAEVTVLNHGMNTVKFRKASYDIIVSATGKAGLIEAKDIDDHAVLVPVSEVRGKDGKLHGDFSISAEKKARLAFGCTKNVGPLTVYEVARNTYLAYLLQNEEYMDS